MQAVSVTNKIFKNKLLKIMLSSRQITFLIIARGEISKWKEKN